MTDAPDRDVILRARGLTKSFAGFVAVDAVDLDVRRGTIHALIGPNGAGKTTCFNLLTRTLPPTQGTIWFDGTDITRWSCDAVARRGLGRTFQVSAVFPHLTARHNVRLPLSRRAGQSYRFWRSSRRLATFDDEADALLSSVGLTQVADLPAGELSYGHRRTLELATTLALAPTLMLLDEPLAGVGREDIERLCDVIRAAARRCTVLLVEHNLQAVAALSDVVTVLNRGQVLAQGDYATVAADPQVAAAYLGRGHG